MSEERATPKPQQMPKGALVRVRGNPLPKIGNQRAETPQERRERLLRFSADARK